MDKENVGQLPDGILIIHTKDEILLFSTMWMELEVIMLSEMSQVQKYESVGSKKIGGRG